MKLRANAVGLIAAMLACVSLPAAVQAYPVGISCHWRDTGHLGLNLWGQEKHWTTIIVEGPIVQGKTIPIHGTPSTFDAAFMYTFTMMDETMATIDSFGLADVQSYDMVIERSTDRAEPVVTFRIRDFHVVGVDGFETQQLPGGVFTADLQLASTRQTSDYLEATYTGEMVTMPMQYKIPGVLDGEFHTYEDATPQAITIVVPVDATSAAAPGTWGGIKALFRD